MMPEQLAETAATRLDAQQVQGAQNTRAAEVAIEDASILRVAGQRWTNRFWEIVQGTLAIMVCGTAMVVVLLLVWRNKDDSALGLLTPTLFTILGFYFARTNHQKVGGVGLRDEGR
jgi:hypothetical protein